MGDPAVLVLADILPKNGAVVTTQFQTAGPVQANGVTARLEGTNGDVTLQTFGPSLNFTVTPRTWSKDWIYKRSGVPWNTLSAGYQIDATKPAVAVFSRVAKGSAPPPVSVDYTANAITVKFVGAPVVMFSIQDGMWKAERSLRLTSPG
jgi:hypothetical protein